MQIQNIFMIPPNQKTQAVSAISELSSVTLVLSRWNSLPRKTVCPRCLTGVAMQTEKMLFQQFCCLGSHYFWLFQFCCFHMMLLALHFNCDCYLIFVAVKHLGHILQEVERCNRIFFWVSYLLSGCGERNEILISTFSERLENEWFSS